jgi:hypothetical protein
VDFGSTTTPGKAPSPQPSLVQTASQPSPRTCLHCNKRPARFPYVYCFNCTKEGHEIARQAAMRNHMTLPKVKVYRWNKTKKKWTLKP